MKITPKAGTILLITIAVMLTIAVIMFPKTPNQPEFDPTTMAVDTNMMACTVGADCMPFAAECHTQHCVNKEHNNIYKPVEACTMIFDPTAAYTKYDCACVSGYCVNTKGN
jgi:hypothetical protein